jgi:hypothetical protein
MRKRVALALLALVITGGMLAVLTLDAAPALAVCSGSGC